MSRRQDRSAWQVASLLLSYPDEQLLDRMPLLRQVVDRLPQRVAEPLDRFLEHVAATAPTELAAHYVETFDQRRRCCLYLTYYAHGDTRNRGVALLKLKNAYRSAGLQLETDELPDHLGVVLEFAAAADGARGRDLLLAHRAGVELLRLALADAGSPYVDVLRAVTATLPPMGGSDRDVVLRLAAEGPPQEEVGLQPFAPPEYMPETMGARR
jgi:nitrate reductase delta subunit